MKLYNTLNELLAEARGKDRHIRFIDGETDESDVRFDELWDRAMHLLGALQQLSGLDIVVVVQGDPAQQKVGDRVTNILLDQLDGLGMGRLVTA